MTTYYNTRYLEPLTGDVFTSHFADCHFNEAIFPPLGGENKNHEKDVSWSEPLLLYLNPHTKQSETEVQKIMHMQEIVNQLPDAFTDPKRVTKSYIPVVNAPARVEIPDVKSDDKVTQKSKACLKRGRPVVTKDKNPRKRKATKNAIIHEDISLEGTQNVAPPEKEINDINKEVLINYGQSKISLDEIKTEIINEKFYYNVACDIMNGNDDPEPTLVIECQIVKPVGYRWVFIQKQNENDEVIRYKARLIAQGFSQRPGIDYEETYSPVMDAITFRYLISLAVYENLDMRLMDVVTAYLYGSLNSDIYMKIQEGFKMPEALSAKPKDIKGYKSNLICPCVFIKKTTSGFAIIVVYVDDLNIIGANKEIDEVVVHLKEEFEMKDLEDEDVLGPEVPHLSAIGALMYLTNYTRPDISFAVNLLARLSSSPMKRH
ncbi:retrovirus-related pol polyprotein from transposon TNT 1-94 [Tanacetum coccineum]